MLTKEDKILVQNVRESKKYGVRRLINEFRNKKWSKRGVEDFLKRLSMSKWQHCKLIIGDDFLWSPYVIGQTIIFLPCDFYLSSSSFFFFLA